MKEAMKDVMIDIETFGTGSDACIVQIGACYFDRYSGKLGAEFEVNIDARTSQKFGGKIDADTLYWWLKQEPAAIAGITNNLLDMGAALDSLTNFIMQKKDPGPKVWSHATFDWPILDSAYTRYGQRFPCHFRNARDVRTICDIAGISNSDIPMEGIAHTALYDCKYQIKQVVLGFQRIKVG